MLQLTIRRNIKKNVFMVISISLFLCCGCAGIIQNKSDYSENSGNQRPDIQTTETSSKDIENSIQIQKQTLLAETKVDEKAAESDTEAKASTEAESVDNVVLRNSYEPAVASEVRQSVANPLKAHIIKPTLIDQDESSVQLVADIQTSGSNEATSDRAPNATVASNGNIVFNFDNADLYEVIRAMAEILSINYIVEPGISGNVTIHTAGELSKKDVFPVFFQILEANGLTAVKEGQLYKIIKMNDAGRLPLHLQTNTTEEAKDWERMIIQIVPLHFIAPEEMNKLLTPFISSAGSIIAHNQTRTLLIIDKKINIIKALKLIEVFDVDMFPLVEHRFYQLQHLSAEDAAKLLSEILSVYGIQNQNQFKMIPLSNTNMLLVFSGEPRLFNTVENFIHKIDIASDSAESSIFIYSVKNAEAKDLGDLLNRLFNNKSDDGKKESKEKPVVEKREELKNSESSSPKDEQKDTAPETLITSTVADTIIENLGSNALKGDIQVIADEIRNALIIEATPHDYRIVENILTHLDTMPRQVLIEVTIADISLDDKTDLGVEWSMLNEYGNGVFSTSLLEASMGQNGFLYTIGQAARWQAEIKALAADNKVNILSSPSILASDNQTARIDISTEVPTASAEYQYGNDSDGVIQTNIEYRNTGIILSVTPHINDRGLVRMEVKQEVSEEAGSLQIGDTAYPSFRKRVIETNLTVRDGQTIVIGGLIRETKEDSTQGAPYLVKIPILKFLFGSDVNYHEKTELIMLLTPRVISSLDDVDMVTQDFKKKVSGMGGDLNRFFQENAK